MTELTKAFCNQCGRETNEEVLYSHRHKYRDNELEQLLREDEPNAEAWHTVLTEMLKCRGCDGPSVRQKTWMGEEERSEADLKSDFPQDWTDYLATVYYPPVFARRKPAWTSPNSEQANAIPDEVKELMQEVYIALQNGSRRLVAMGIRTALDRIMQDKIGDHENFREYLDEFQAAHYVSQRHRNIL